MATLTVHYQDMKEETLEQAKKVNIPFTLSLTPIINLPCLQLILDTFETCKEERIIANKIRAEFDKTHGK